MRIVRRLGAASLILVVVCGAVAWFGGRSVVATRFSDALGLPVHVSALSVGLSSAQIALRVGDPVDPLLTIDSATVDGSPWSVADASLITLKGVRVTLAVSADDRLLTQFPAAGPSSTKLPPVAVEDLAVTIRQEGRPEFTVANLRAVLTPAEGGYSVAGTAADPAWGAWTFRGTYIAGGTTTVSFSATEESFTIEQLRSIPFVPPDVWERVKPRGRAGATVTLEFPPTGRVRYRVQLDVKDADVDVPDIDCPFRGVSGGVEIRDGLVTLTDCKGRLAAGSVTAGGTLDFVPVPSRLTFRIAAAGLDVKQMPAAWGLPKAVTGTVRGKLDLDLKVHADGRLETGGSGTAVVDDARIVGMPAEIKIRLKPDGPRFRFVADRAAGVTRVSPVRQARTQPPTGPAAALEANVTLKDVDLAELLTKLEVSSGYKLGGKVSVAASVAVPLGRPEGTRHYRVNGKLTAPTLTLERLTLADAAADLAFTEGRLSLTDLRAAFADSPGKLTGTAAADVDPPGDLTADLKLSGVPLAAVLKAIPAAAESGVAAAVDGTAMFRAPWPKLADPTTWTGSATLTAPSVAFAGLSAADVRMTAALTSGTLTIQPATGTVAGTPATFTGSLGLGRPFPFTATLRTKPTAASDLRPLLPDLGIPFPIAGRLTAEATARGTFGPAAFSSAGTAAVEDLTLRGAAGNALKARWELTADRVRITEFSAKLFGGTAAGSADVPLTPRGSGSFAANFSELDAAAAGKGFGDIPLTVTGKAAGKIAGTFPAGPRAADFTLDLTAEKLTLQGVPTEKVKATVNAAGKVAQYRLEGKALGGTFEVTGRYPAAEKGSLRVRGLDLRRLGFEALGPLRGSVDVSAEFDADFAAGTGRATARVLRWGDALLAEELSGLLKLSAGQLELVDFGGPFSGGSLRVRGRVPLEDPGRNFFTATVTRAVAQTVFAPVPELKDVVAGEVSAVVRGRLGRGGRGSGAVELPRGSLFGFAVADVRLPFDWQSGAGGHGQFRVRDAVGLSGSGRLAGEAEYAWGFEPRLEGRVRFTDVKLAAVAPGVPAVGGSRFSGKFDVKAGNLRSAKDLTGALSGTLSDTAVGELPVLRQLVPYLSPGGVVAPFQSGEVSASLGKGVFRVERLALTNPGGTQLYADGTVTLAKKVDLDVVATTGSVGPAVPVLRTLSVSLPPIGPVPLVVVREVSRALSNRVVRLHVTGTTAHPQVRINTAALLSDNAVRYLLSRYLDPVR